MPPIAADCWRSASGSCPRFRVRRSPPISCTARPTLRSTYCEDVPPLPRAAVDKIVYLFENAGGIAKVSSIHVNWMVRPL